MEQTMIIVYLSLTILTNDQETFQQDTSQGSEGQSVDIYLFYNNNDI